MARFSSKTNVLGILLFITVAGGAVLLAKQTEKARAAAAPPSPPKIRGEVQAVSPPPEKLLQVCYNSLIQRRPGTDNGMVQVHWVSDAEGKIDYLNLVHSDFSDEEFTGCVVTQLKTARQPATKDRAGILVSHKFKFKRRDGGNADFASQE